MNATSLEKTLILGGSSKICFLLRDVIQRENIVQPFYHFRKFDSESRIERDVNFELTAEAMRNFVKVHSIENIVIFSGSKSHKEEDLFLNKEIIKKKLEIIKNIPLKKILIASSASVYGNYKNEPFKESDECRPITNYGKSKLLMEKVAYENYQKFENTHCLRIANFLGADALAENYEANKNLVISQYEDKKGPLRTFVNARQLLKVLMTLITIEKKIPFAINVGNLVPTYMEELASLAGMKWSFTKETKNDASQRIVLDCSYLSTLMDLEEIVYKK